MLTSPMTPDRRGALSIKMKCAGLALAVIPSLAVANPPQETANPLTISGSIRSRTEAVAGQFRPDAAETDQLWSIRSAILAEYDAGSVRIGGELIDSRGYGQDADSMVGPGEINALELVQAYVAVDLSKSATVQAGRFSYHLGAGRLAAAQRYRNAQNGFTGVNLDWRYAGKDRLQIFWTMPQIRLPDDRSGVRNARVVWDKETTDLQFYGANLTKAGLIPDGSVEFYAFGLSEKDSATRPTRNRRLVTPGIRLSRRPGKGAFDFDIEANYQFGHIRGSAAAADRTDLDVSARNVHFEVGKRFATDWSPRVSLLFDYASGDGPDGSFGRFDGLYGAARTDLGPTSLYSELGRGNIVTPGFRVEAKPSDRLDGFFHFRELWLDTATDSFATTRVRDRSGLSGKHAGRQFEVRARYWIIPETAMFEVGATYLDKGRFLDEAPNARRTGDTRHAYADVTFEF